MKKNLEEDVTERWIKPVVPRKIHLLFSYQQQWEANMKFNLGKKIIIMFKVVFEKIPPALKNGMKMGQD